MQYINLCCTFLLERSCIGGVVKQSWLCCDVVGGPDPPTNVQAHVISSRSIEVSWDESPPKFNVPTIAYSIHYVSSAGTLTLRCSNAVLNRERILFDFHILN